MTGLALVGGCGDERAGNARDSSQGAGAGTQPARSSLFATDTKAVIRKIPASLTQLSQFTLYVNGNI